MSSIAVLRTLLHRRRINNNRQKARRQTVTGISERLSLHLAQADEYERLWYRRVAWTSRRRNRELTLLDQIRTLRQRVLELEAQNDELAAFDRTVAHNIKNPLALIIGFAEALGEQGTVMPEEKLRGYLCTIARYGHKLNGIVDRLLLLAGACEMEVEVVPLDMANIVAEALERLASMIEEYRAEIILPDDWPAALGYGPWVEEVWANYVSNAVRYGGAPPRVELGATEQTDGTVRFWVRDNGPGLSPEEQSRLFTPFTRLHQDCGQGHGLGLSIVRQIVEKLGGQVGVESDGVPGHGSIFGFSLPEANG